MVSLPSVEGDGCFDKFFEMARCCRAPLWRDIFTRKCQGTEPLSSDGLHDPERALLVFGQPVLGDYQAPPPVIGQRIVEDTQRKTEIAGLKLASL